MVISAFFLFIAAGASIFAINVFTRAFSMVVGLLKWILRFILFAFVIGLAYNHQAVTDAFLFIISLLFPQG